MSGFVLTERERLLALEEAERTFPMNEDEFRAFYELTARPVWVYINRMTGDGRLADDLLQEAYYRLLRTTTRFESDDHRRNYLYRIATNLVHDYRRRPRADREPLLDAETRSSAPVSRIIWSMQAGIVLMALGGGLLWVQKDAIEEVRQAMNVMQAIVGSVGAGLLVSAVAAYVVSGRLGLLPPKRTAEHAK